MKVMIVMGSSSDWEVMKGAQEILQQFEVEFEKKVVSAHRMPHELPVFAKYCEENQFDAIIAGAGGAAHLPGMLAAFGVLPVIGVPVKSSNLSGVDSLYSIVQMPKGVPVATVGINNSVNAALLALRMGATGDKALREKLIAFGASEYERAKSMSSELD
ncbi:MAG: 5-(carboxyamino)imidazole ribonucleotide mutase [Halobacteriovoraceae bacterium]|nr:5-(carboxyamino)imidazole ribonucleotide mutase [Halobacteriovoraceae bacterium]|tara:strand:+ start:373 stop:849 length:477 start_codon:yes stop_codon:yes gene_type:complete